MAGALSERRDMTVLMVAAHRMSTVLDADQVVVLDEGRVGPAGA